MCGANRTVFAKYCHQLKKNSLQHSNTCYKIIMKAEYSNDNIDLKIKNKIANMRVIV